MIDYVEKMLMKSEGEEAEVLSLQRMKTTRSSGKPSKKSDFSGVSLQVLSFFPHIIFFHFLIFQTLCGVVWCGVVWCSGGGAYMFVCVFL